MRLNVIKHGMRKSPEYRAWCGMHQRVKGQTHDSHLYVGKGITVCVRWKTFAAFFQDMGPRPTPQHSIDRIDGTKGYCPENCRWATPKEQGRNKSNNAVISWNGESLCLAQWSERTGIKQSTIRERLNRGYSPEEALKTSRYARVK